MTFFWNLLQDHRYFKERGRADDIEKRIERIEHELADLRDLMSTLLHELEVRLGEDLNGDGCVGEPESKPIRVRRTRDNRKVREQIARQEHNTPENRACR